MTGCRSLIAAVSLMLGLLPQLGLAEPNVPVIFAADNVQQEEENRGLLLHGLYYFFHDGSFDLYNLGEPAGPTISRYVSGMSAALAASILVPAFRAMQPQGYVAMIGNGFCYVQIEDQWQVWAREQQLDPQKHRYLSYLGQVFPSDDAFVANDDPKAHPVFDDEGRFLGPIVIELTGEHVLDAGTRINDETDIPLFDIIDNEGAVGTAENQPIRRHPGFNGSARDPAGTPQRILGGTASYIRGPDCTRNFTVDPVRGDFTRTDFESLDRFRLTSRLSHHFSGAWYDPARSGEGFFIHVFDALTPKLSVAWFTYQADGSGKQKWLIGSGPISDISAEIELFEAEGGVMGSLENPQRVQTRRWGMATVGFGACSEGVAYIRPDDAAQFSGGIPLRRLTPVPAGAQDDCGHWSLAAPFPLPLPPGFEEQN